MKLAKSTKNDSIKADLFISVSDEYWSDNPAKCREYAQLALNLAKKLSSHGLMSTAYKNLGSASSFVGKSKEALHYDSLCLVEAILSGDEKKLPGLYANLGDDLTRESSFDEADMYLNRGIMIAKKFRDTVKLDALYINKGNNFYYQSKFDSCEKYFQEALNNAALIKDSVNVVKCLNNIATIRLQRGIADSMVISYLMKSILINETQKHYLDLGDNYNTLAAAYNLRKNPEKAIYYLRKSNESYDKVPNEQKTVPVYASMADQFRQMKINDSALFYANLAIEKGNSTDFRQGLAAAYSIKGITLSDQGKYDSALYYLDKAFKDHLETQDGEGIFLSAPYLAEVLNKQGKYKQAETVALTVYHLADSNKNFQVAKTTSRLLAEIFHKQGNDAKAFEFANLYIAASDTLDKVQNDRLLEEMVAKYESAKKEIKYVESTAKLVGLIVAVFILAIVIFFLVRNNRLQAKTNRLKSIIEANNIRQRISKDLHDGIGSDLTKISMLSRQGTTDIKNNVPVTLSLFEKIDAKSRELSENLDDLTWSTNPQNDNLSQLIIKIRSYTFEFLENSAITPIVNLPDDVVSFAINPETNRNIYLILKEGLNNIVKHSQAKNARISLNVDSAMNFKFEIEDDGKGFDPARQTDRNGRKNIEKRVAYIKNGQLKVESTLGNGTRLSIVGNLA